MTKKRAERHPQCGFTLRLDKETKAKLQKISDVLSISKTRIIQELIRSTKRGAR
jgi:predicted transcriptional regulator